jgi:hypothetical protein
MGKLHKKIIEVLRPHLSDLHDALDDLPGGRVSGVIISSSFVEMDYRSRQQKLNTLLENALTPAEFSATGAIAALTPAEAKVSAN